MKKGIAIIAVLAMIMTLFTVPVSAFEQVESETPNYAFIPNSGEASVSKVDLVNMEEVARYYTEPRGTTAEDYNWRTSRIAMDADGNAWVLNTGADGTNLQGSVARIQADTTGLTTHLYPDPVLAFGTDEAVSVFNIGDPGDMPRAIAIDSEGFIWIGFYSSGALMKYAYNGTTLVPQFTEPIFNGDNKLNYYEMKFAPDGTLYISSRNSTPARTGNYGVWSFDPDSELFTEEWDVDSPYSLLIDPVSGQVYATSYGTGLWIEGTGVVPISGAQNLRGMAFDGLGKIWIASTTGGSGGDRICWYDIDSETSGYITLPIGTTPVGVGKDAAGLMWAVCRTDNGNRTNGGTGGYIVAFDPATKLFVTDGYVQVGYRPYAYGDFVVPPPPTYNICGFKSNADTEDPINDWGISLFLWDEALNDGAGGYPEYPLMTTTSGAVGIDGKYCFTDLLAGKYLVVEDFPDGWIPIDPANGEHEVTLPGGATDETMRVPLYYNFENAPIYNICGFKWEYEVENPGEGWTINLFKWDEELNDNEGGFPAEPMETDVTGSDGKYCFEGLRAGRYMVTETLKDGWIQLAPTDPDYYDLSLPEDASDCDEGPFYDFLNDRQRECFDETVWAAQDEPGVTRFVSKGNWATYVQYTMGGAVEGQPATFPLYAGQTHLAGWLLVYDAGGSIFVKYIINEPDDAYKDGYCGEWTGLTEYHLQVVDEFDGFQPYRTFNKRSGYGNPIPGSFDLTMEFEAEDKVGDTGWIEVTGVFETDVYIAAHGVAWWCGYMCDDVTD